MLVVHETWELEAQPLRRLSSHTILMLLQQQEP
jgi:hypothetical protein